jgi:muconolactone D-isomerase
MEFLVRQLRQPSNATLSEDERERLRVLERARAQELRDAGVLVRLWRVLGSNDSVGLYRAADSDALHDALVSLPMYAHLRFEVEALVTHPQEKKA